MNFQPGRSGYQAVCPHPNGCDAVVFASGAGYVVEPTTRSLKAELGEFLENAWPLQDPPRIVVQSQGLYFFCLAADGVLWHTRRLSWDGFRDVVVSGERLEGLAWDLGDSWVPFEVDLVTGRSFNGATIEGIPLDVERLAGC